MGYGDAFVYCLILTPQVVRNIQKILFKIAQKQKDIDEILEDMEKHPICNKIRGQTGLMLMDQQGEMYGEILTLCKNPIAIHHIATDDWLEAWSMCSRFNFVPMKVSELIQRAHGKMWCDESLKSYNDYMCMCIPSHYDTDTELLMDLCGVEHHKEYKNRR